MLNSRRQNFTRDKNHIIYTHVRRITAESTIHIKKLCFTFACQICKPIYVLHYFAKLFTLKFALTLCSLLRLSCNRFMC